MAPHRTQKPHEAPLQKGLACATCKARKVKCDAVAPACGACVRTARFEGRSVESVTCCYNVGRRVGGRRGKGKALDRKQSSTSQSTSPEPSTSSQSSFTAYTSQATATSSAPAYTPPRPVSAAVGPQIPQLPLASTLPPLPSLFQYPSTFDLAYTPQLLVTASTPSNELGDYWSASDFSSTLGASLGVDSFPWSFDDYTSSSPTSSYASSHYDDHVASPDSLHSASDFSSCHSPEPYLADDFALSFFGSSKQDETLSLPLFPLALPPKMEEPTPWLGGWESAGFGVEGWTAMA